MSPPLPVPSKAALRALRGLILGTSCTLALITEDRRRRIDYALKILENGERVKGARNYRASGEQLASVLAAAEDDAITLDPSVFRLYPRPSPSPPTIGPPRASRSRLREDGGAVAAPLSRDSDTERRSGEIPLVASSGKPPVETIVEEEDPFAVMVRGDVTSANLKPRGSKKRSTPSWGTSISKPTDPSDSFTVPVSIPVESISSPDRRERMADAIRRAIENFAFPSNGKIVAMIHEACRAKSPSEVDGAVQHVLSAYEAGLAPKDLDEEWLAACALLCRTCQELGRVEDATKLLTSALSRTRLPEQVYFSFEPLSLITSLLKGLSEDQKSSLRIMDSCITLFLPKFTDKPQQNGLQVFEVGKALLEAEFELDRLEFVRHLYNRCVAVGGCCEWEFTEWFIDKLHQKAGYKQALRIFTSRYINTVPVPTPESVIRVGSIVVKCVEAVHSYNSQVVLGGLIKLAKTTGCKLKAEWVMRLLTSSWKKHNKLNTVELLYNEITAAGLDRIVFNPAGVCRVMAEIALEAGDHMRADYYIAQGTALDPSFAQNPRLMGILARFDAKIGNWEGVRRYFVEMEANIQRLATQESIEAANKARSDAFVPILKIYASQHPIQETERFLKLYTESLKVPVSSYMVPLVAKHYSALRDFKSLGDWLLYCARVAPKVDASFSNAIITSCRHSQMSFYHLQRLFHELRKLSPDFIDVDLERIMINSAVSDFKHGGRLAWRRIRALKVFPHLRAVQGRCASPEEVRLAMKQLMRCGRPSQALSTYKRALHNGMPLENRTLRLAIRAQLEFPKYGRTEGRCFRNAWKLVMAARTGGLDVDHTANYLVSKQLKAACAADISENGVFGAIRAAVYRCESAGIKILDEVLHGAGFACLGAGKAKSAVLFAEQAAEVSAGGAACYNTTNFRLFLLAYAELLSVEGLRGTINLMMASHYKENRIVRDTLNHAKLVINKSTRGGFTCGAEGKLALEIVAGAIRDIVAARKQLRAKRKSFTRAAMGIMRDAARDAGYEVSPPDLEFDDDFDDEWSLDFGEGGIEWRDGGGGGGTAAASSGLAAPRTASEVDEEDMLLGKLEGGTAAAVEMVVDRKGHHLPVVFTGAG